MAAAAENAVHNGDDGAVMQKQYYSDSVDHCAPGIHTDEMHTSLVDLLVVTAYAVVPGGKIDVTVVDLQNVSSTVQLSSLALSKCLDLHTQKVSNSCRELRCL